MRVLQQFAPLSQRETPAAMADRSEGDLAWYLAEHYCDQLDVTERDTVFIHLGIEDYPPAIVCILTALARRGRTVSESAVRQLHSWVTQYHHHECEYLVDRVAVTGRGS